MGFVTENEIRNAARHCCTLAKKASAILAERASNKGPFDIFLCHAVSDAEIILGTVGMLQDEGFNVYVDWIDDPHLDRNIVNGQTAATLRLRLRDSKCLIYVHTRNSSESVWMPWELGYFDAYRSKVAVLPIVQSANSGFAGAEYLSLYHVVSRSQADHSLKVGLIDLHGWIEGNRV